MESKNRMIANLMDRYKGCPIEQCEDEIVVSVKESKWGNDEVIKRPFTYSDIGYAVSWDLLIPVVKKIKELPIDDFRKNDAAMSLTQCDIKITYEVVTEFISWYNKQKDGK